MIFRVPHYYKKFKCIADKCKDNCCIGWEIDIDKETAEKYRNVKGEFGTRLKNNISFGKTSSFILGENDRCPFLNDCNLCDIISTLCESELCQICSDHPRFYEWFDNVTEGGIGMSCEAAARIILTETKPFSFVDETDDEQEKPKNSFYRKMVRDRKKLFTILDKKSVPFDKRLSDIIDTVWHSTFFYSAFNDFYEDECSDIESFNVKELLELFKSLEYIDKNWINSITRAIEKLPELKENRQAFIEQNPQIINYLKNIAEYFIWRYYTKDSVSQDYVVSTIFAVVSVCVIALLWEMKWLENGLTEDDCIEIAKNYSKEIEYSTENVEKLKEYFAFCKSIECIKGLIMGITE